MRSLKVSIVEKILGSLIYGEGGVIPSLTWIPDGTFLSLCIESRIQRRMKGRGYVHCGFMWTMVILQPATTGKSCKRDCVLQRT